MTRKEMETMHRFLTDMGSGAELSQEQGDFLQKICRAGKSSYEAGDCILDVDINGQYGNISIYYIDSVAEHLDDEDNKVGPDGGWASIHGEAVTIYFGRKGHDGPEPYNCQGQLYIPYRWSDLTLVEEGNGHDVYISSRRKTNISFSIQKFWYNDFWKKCSFGMVISPKDKDATIQAIVKCAGLA